ncbi:uncharacterized protein LOC135155185 isoform X2 [Lytechinus pictus]|uniref:uncharacterized protein LOC135155185 isoform X2 n=1 Tax=Lytechinus pictus TaxID=7653 RepID=UPI0030B9CB1E
MVSFVSSTRLFTGFYRTTREHFGKCLRNRQLFTRSCIMQRETTTMESVYHQFQRFLKDILKASPDKYPKSYHLKQFGWNDFNKIGAIHPHYHVGYSLMAALQLHSPVAADGEPEKSTSYFGRSFSLNFRPAYHSTNFVSRPVRYDSYIAYLGRASTYIGIELRDDESDLLYMTGQMQCITIDLKEKKLVPVSLESIKKYEGKIMLKEAPKRHQFIPAQFAKDNVFKWKTATQWSDVDHNGHVNQMPYMRFIYDAGSSAAVAGFLKSFHRELIHYRLKTYAVEYIKEIHQGQELKIFCWEMKDSPGTIHFEFHVEGHVVSRSHLIFDVQHLAEL